MEFHDFPWNSTEFHETEVGGIPFNGIGIP
jgi:hypothetical protein